MNKVDTARGLLWNWMTCCEGKRSYESIRKNCEYLDEVYNLGLGSYAVWTLFQPLFRSGVVEFVGKDCYAVSPAVAIERNGLFLYNSPVITNAGSSTSFPGIFVTRSEEEVKDFKRVQFDALSVLKGIPSANEVVDAFSVSVEDLSHVDYYHYKGKKGLTKRLEDGAVRYFCIPEKLYQREIPGRATNPDAFGIAYCYSCGLNGETKGYYNKNNGTLRMRTFGLPATIERILFLESMTQGIAPVSEINGTVYHKISLKVAKEINRILCNTFEYE